MADSSSFSSLMALVDSHLSKCNVQNQSEDAGNNSINSPRVAMGQIGPMSDTALTFSPSQRLPIPSLSTYNSPIIDRLQEQVRNMFMRKEEEKKRLEEEMNKMALEDKSEPDDDYVIDLMAALKTPWPPAAPEALKESLSCKGSSESLNIGDFEEFSTYDNVNQDTKKVDIELLPCVTDMSYILKQKIKRAKCSQFGKVLSARLRPVAAPYLKEKIETNIKHFDFQTKSPDDLVMEKLRKPAQYSIVETLINMAYDESV